MTPPTMPAIMPTLSSAVAVCAAPGISSMDSVFPPEGVGFAFPSAPVLGSTMAKVGSLSTVMFSAALAALALARLLWSSSRTAVAVAPSGTVMVAVTSTLAGVTVTDTSSALT